MLPQVLMEFTPGCLNPRCNACVIEAVQSAGYIGNSHVPQGDGLESPPELCSPPAFVIPHISGLRARRWAL